MLSDPKDSPVARRNQFEIYQIIPVDFIVPGLVAYFTWIFSPGIFETARAAAGNRCGLRLEAPKGLEPPRITAG
jgi:hypothetical protein